MSTETTRYLDARFRMIGMEAKDQIAAGDILAAQHRLGMMHGINLALEAESGFCPVRDAMMRVVANFISDSIDAESAK